MPETSHFQQNIFRTFLSVTGPKFTRNSKADRPLCDAYRKHVPLEPLQIDEQIEKSNRWKRLSIDEPSAYHNKP